MKVESTQLLIAAGKGTQTYGIGLSFAVLNLGRSDCTYWVQIVEHCLYVVGGPFCLFC